jgi:hypothetical protein
MKVKVKVKVYFTLLYVRYSSSIVDMKKSENRMSSRL